MLSRKRREELEEWARNEFAVVTTEEAGRLVAIGLEDTVDLAGLCEGDPPPWVTYADIKAMFDERVRENGGVVEHGPNGELPFDLTIFGGLSARWFDVAYRAP